MKTDQTWVKITGSTITLKILLKKLTHYTI
jgi:hypothetical protein